MGCKMDVVLAGMKQHNLHVHPHRCSWMTKVLCQWAITHHERNLCFWSVGLTMRLKLFNKPYCKQICCHSGFIVSFIEHWQVLNAPKIFSEDESALASTALLAPNKRISLSFKALFPGVTYPLFYDRIFFHSKAVLSHWKLVCLVKPTSLIILARCSG